MIIYDKNKKELVIPNGLGNQIVTVSQEALDNAYADGHSVGMEEQAAIDELKLTESITFTQNGQYDASYGYKSVEVAVDLDTPYQEGYKDGEKDGKEAQAIIDEGKLTDAEFSRNGSYTAVYGYKTVEVNVPVDDYYDDGYNTGLNEGKQTQREEDENKLTEKEITANGSYTADYGFSKVTVNVDTTAAFNEGKVEGKKEQLAEDENKLTTKQITKNGNYKAEFGFSEVEVNIEMGQSYEDGFADGREAQAIDDENRLSTTTIEGNGVFKAPYGFSEVTVNIDTTAEREEAYNEGNIAGKQEQRIEDESKLNEITISNNGTYTADYGYSKVIVDIDDSDSFDEGVVEGKKQQLAEDEAKLETKTITENGTYTAEFGFSKVTVDIDTTAEEEAAYHNGYVDGERNQREDDYARLEERTITKNGNYIADYGYSKIVVAVDGGEGCEGVYEVGYAEGRSKGFDEGVADQKSKLSERTINANGTYTSENGFSKVIVSVDAPTPTLQSKSVAMSAATTTVTPDSGYQGLSSVLVDASAYGTSRYNVGVADQKAKLTERTITSNGTYTSENGLKKVIVSVDAPTPTLQEKNVTMSTATTSVTPDSSYQGLSKVNVDATAYGTTRYNAGKADQKTEDSGKMVEKTITENGVYVPTTAEFGYKKVTVNVETTITVECSQAEYDAMATHPDNIIYLING